MTFIKRARTIIEARSRFVYFIWGRSCQSFSGLIRLNPISSSVIRGFSSTRTCKALHQAVRKAVLSGSTFFVLFHNLCGLSFYNDRYCKNAVLRAGLFSRSSVSTGECPRQTHDCLLLARTWRNLQVQARERSSNNEIDQSGTAGVTGTFLSFHRFFVHKNSRLT